MSRQDWSHKIAYEVLDVAGHTLTVRVIEADTRDEAEAIWRVVSAGGRVSRLDGVLIALPAKRGGGER